MLLLLLLLLVKELLVLLFVMVNLCLHRVYGLLLVLDLLLALVELVLQGRSFLLLARELHLVLLEQLLVTLRRCLVATLDGIETRDETRVRTLGRLEQGVHLLVLLLGVLQLVDGRTLLVREFEAEMTHFLVMASYQIGDIPPVVTQTRLECDDATRQPRLLHAQLDGRVLQHLVHRRTTRRIFLQHLHDQETKLRRNVTRQRRR